MPPERETGLKLVIAYKLVRAGLSFIGGVTLWVLLDLGELSTMHEISYRLHLHTTSAIATELSRAILSAAEPRHVVIGIVALFLDTAVLCLEGWALYKGHLWGTWLVVAASCAPVPFELAALVRHMAWGRVLVLAVNLVIVTYLLWRAFKHRAKHAKLGQNARRAKDDLGDGSLHGAAQVRLDATPSTASADRLQG